MLGLLQPGKTVLLPTMPDGAPQNAAESFRFVTSVSLVAGYVLRPGVPEIGLGNHKLECVEDHVNCARQFHQRKCGTVGSRGAAAKPHAPQRVRNLLANG